MIVTRNAHASTDNHESGQSVRSRHVIASAHGWEWSELPTRCRIAQGDFDTLTFEASHEIQLEPDALVLRIRVETDVHQAVRGVNGTRLKDAAAAQDVDQRT